MALEGVLLDVDGTLIDSNDAHARSWVEAFAESGVEVAFDRVRRLIGKGGDKLVPEVSGIDPESERGEAVSKRRGEIFQQKYLPTLRPFPAAEEMLRRMKESGLKLVVASSARKGELESLLRVCGADRYVEERTSSDDAEGSKPDPDIIHVALERIGLPADRVLMLGDTPYDVEAARKAGVGTVAVRCGGWADADLKGAVAVFTDPAEIVARFDRSPFAGR